MKRIVASTVSHMLGARIAGRAFGGKPMSDNRRFAFLARCLRYSPIVAVAALAAAGCTASASAGPDDTSVPTGCTADSTLNCEPGSDGYSCDTADRPETEDPSLVCSDDATPDSNGNLDYCCITFATSSSTCTEDDSVTATCEFPSYGFSCATGDDPTSLDSSLNCSTPTTLSDGSDGYCCT
jgi:hypothetical protein